MMLESVGVFFKCARVALSDVMSLQKILPPRLGGRPKPVIRK
jgi:hypothetical protein